MSEQIFVTHSSMPPYEEYCNEIKSIWETVQLTNGGPIHNRFKDAVREYLKVQHLELFVNGHLALYCALKALKLSGEIITTPFTFASTTNAIVQAGCTPVFCDVKPDYTIDEEKIEALITEKTTAILGVHVYGNICNVEKIDAIAKKHGLRAIYDAAHAFGVQYKGRGIADFGDVSMLSFHATKVFHTIEGGCVCFHDEALKKELTLQRNFGVDGETLQIFGTNAKMNEFQAAMGICNLRHIDDELALRAAVFKRYSENLQSAKGIKILKDQENVKRNFAYYPILVDPESFGVTRDDLIQKLQKNGIYARKYFYPLTSENKAFPNDLAEKTPVAKQDSERVLCLPMYAHLKLSDVDRICRILLQK